MQSIERRKERELFRAKIQDRAGNQLPDDFMQIKKFTKLDNRAIQEEFSEDSATEDNYNGSAFDDFDFNAEERREYNNNLNKME